MKTIYLVRHAKSSWDDSDLTDFERPLNERGKRDAPAMAERLKEKNIRPQYFLSSAAKRAASTSKRFARVLGHAEEKIDFQKKLYHASAEDILRMLTSIPDKFQSAILFGHNPGITDLANELMDKGFLTDNIPTCGIVAFNFSISSWKEAAPKKGKLLFFDYPKNSE
jgi:phosphohistidine phosphatase